MNEKLRHAERRDPAKTLNFVSEIAMVSVPLPSGLYGHRPPDLSGRSDLSCPLFPVWFYHHKALRMIPSRTQVCQALYTAFFFLHFILSIHFLNFRMNYKGYDGLAIGYP